MFSAIRRRGILALLVVSAAGVLSAGIIDSNAVNFSVNGTFHGSFNQFNPALGTLTGVTLFYNNTVLQTEDVVQSPTGATPVSIFADFFSGFTLDVPGVATINPFLSFTQTHFGCTSNHGEFDSCSNDQLFTQGPLSGSVGLSPIPNLNAYIGLSTVALTLTSSSNITNITSSATLVNPIGTNVFTTNRVDTGNMFLEYTYAPAVDSGTPEPASWGLIGVGLIALGFLRPRALRRS